MLGMYVERLGRSWLENPFWKRSFLLESPADMERIRVARLNEVWIDTARGLAPPEPVAAPPVAAAGTVCTEAEAQAVSVAVAHVAPALSREAEMAHARRLLERTRQAVQTMFDEARMGKALAVGQAYELVDDIASSVLRGGGLLLGLARLKTADN